MTYKLLQGDCLELMKDIPDGSVDAIVTDPPYKYLKHKLETNWDEERTFKEWDRILKDDGFIVIFGRGESFYRWNVKLNELGFKFKEEVIWFKKRSSSPAPKLSRTHETVSILGKKGVIRKVKRPYLEKTQYDIEKIRYDLRTIISGLGKYKELELIQHFLNTGEVLYTVPRTNNHDDLTGNVTNGASRKLNVIQQIFEGTNEIDVMYEKHDAYFKGHHPTQKPVRLMERLINLVSDEGATICDPFMGSGSTGIASLNTNRDFIGIELDEEYFNGAKQRIQEADSE